MKEAAGEANMTVITIVLIAIVLGIGTLVVTNLMNNTSQKADCTAQGGDWYNGKCCMSPVWDSATGKVTGCNS